MFSRRSIARRLLLWRKPKFIFVACFPKSGSTYLYRVLRELTGYRTVRAVLTYGHNEQDLFEFRIREARHDSIIRQHTKAGRNNLEVMARHGLKPVVLVRDIFDIVPSIYDHTEKDHVYAMAFVHREYAGMSRDQKMMWIIRAVLPWYFHFLFSWREARAVTPTHWLLYRNLFANPRKELADILRYYELPVDEGKIDRAIAAVEGQDTNRNVGQVGRGQTVLSEEHTAAIRELASRWGADGCEELKLIGL